MFKKAAVFSVLTAGTLLTAAADACLGDWVDAYRRHERPLQAVFPGGQRMAQNHVFFGGWINAGLTVNTDSPENKHNGPLAFNCRANEAHLHQAYFKLSRPADIGQPGFSYGFAFDLLFGTDAHFVSADDWDEKWNTGDTYGFALPQRYGELANGSFSVLAGHFTTLVGYEVAKAPDNFFYSHSYTTTYAEPFTHTGILASYHGFEDSTVYGAWTSGWDAGLTNDVDGNPGFMGGITTYLSDDSSVTLNFTLGNHPLEGKSAYDKGFRSLVTATLKAPISDNMRCATHAVYGRQERTGKNGEASNWYGLTQYVYYDFNDSISAGTRLEWLCDDNGLVPQEGDCEPQGFGRRGTNWITWTSGLRVQPCQHLIVRPELRFDWCTGSVTPFDSATASSQFTTGVDAILIY